MQRLTLAAALVTAWCALEIPLAHAAGSEPLLRGSVTTSLEKVVAPKQGGLLTGRRLHVTVRMRPGLRGFQAWLDSKDVTRSFKRSGNSRQAVLRPNLGVNHLYVRVRDSLGRRDFDYVRFVRADRRRSVMQLRIRARGGRVPVTVRLHRKNVKLRAFLNGKRLRSVRDARFVLDGDAGLRFGRNTIRFVAFTESGIYDIERRVVRVGRRYPIPAAGANRRIRSKHVIRLDARRSKATRKLHKLGYRWRIVKKPKGSKARLRNAGTARPSLRPDRVGTYRLGLGLNEQNGNRARDALTITAVPNAPLIGIPIDTMMSTSDPGVKLGAPINQTYESGGGVQMVAFDRTTLKLRADISVAANLIGMQALQFAVGKLDSNVLVIIAAPPGAGSGIPIQDPSAVSLLNQVLSTIGVQDADQGSVANPPPEGFSAVGVTGAVCCTGALNSGLTEAGADGVARPSGDLHGYLQLDNTQHYGFVNADYVTLNTQAPGTTASQAAVRVGNQIYTSNTLPAGQAGFYLLLLDAGTLQLVHQDTEAVSGGGISPFAAANNLFQLTQDIESAHGDPSKLLVLQSIGQPQRTDDNTGGLNSAWDDFAAAQTQIGGNGLYLNTLSPGAGYSYVGPAQGSPGGGSEFSGTSTAAATGGGNPGLLTGMLQRNAASQYYPGLAGPLTPTTAQLPVVVYQDPVPWPLRGTAVQRAAMTCIAAALGVPAPIEDDYTNESYNFAGLAGVLDNIKTPPGLIPCAHVQQSDFAAAKTELVTEFNYVSTLRTLIGNLQKPLVADAASVQANLASIVQAIQSSTDAGDSNTTAQAQEIMNAFFSAGSNIPGIGPLISLDGSWFELTADMVNNPDGSNEATQEISVSADDLGDELGQRFSDTYFAMDQLGDIIAGDYGKLQTVFNDVGSQWAWSAATGQAAADSVTSAVQLEMYEALFPLRYSLYRFGDQQLTDAGDYSCFGAPLTVGNFNPFGGEPNGGNTVVTNAGPATDLWAFGIGNDPNYTFLQQNANVRLGNSNSVGPPPQSLWNSMFSIPVSATLNAPPLPSQLRFMLDAYGTPQHVITRDDFDECLVDGQLPPG